MNIILWKTRPIFKQLDYVSDEKWKELEPIFEEVVSEFISEEVIEKWRY